MGAIPWIPRTEKNKESEQKSPSAILKTWEKENVPIEMRVCPFTRLVTLRAGTRQSFSIFDYSLAKIGKRKVLLTNALTGTKEFRHSELILESLRGEILYSPFSN